jgi:hypothetical protein
MTWVSILEWMAWMISLLYKHTKQLRSLYRVKVAFTRRANGAHVEVVEAYYHRGHRAPLPRSTMRLRSASSLPQTLERETPLTIVPLESKMHNQIRGSHNITGRFQIGSREHPTQSHASTQATTFQLLHNSETCLRMYLVIKP